MPSGMTAKEKGPAWKGPATKNRILKMIRFKIIFRIGKIRIQISNY